MRSELRVYVQVAGTNGSGKLEVFYSRRSSGPFYRWFLEQESEKWRSLRVHPNIRVIRSLSLASWSSVPPALQARLDEHYLE